MAKKKEKKIYNIDEINLEIDYDKLAAAIVKANEQQADKYSISREWMKFIIYPVFWGIAIISGLFSIISFVYGIGVINAEFRAMQNADWQQVAIGFIVVCIGFFLITVCMSTAFTAQEIDKEKDRQYVASMFSNIVALVALVVSLVALVKR